MRKRLSKQIINYGEFPLLSLIFFALLAISWGKLPQYFVAWNMDLGKEIMVPLRILNGEVPLRDFGLLYPPIPYYLNAGFLYLFGKTFNNFFLLGAIQSFLYLFIAWKFLKEISVTNWYRWLMILILITCGIFPGENDGRFIFPYTYNWSYSLIFSFSVLLFMARYLETKKRLFLWGSGILCGLVLLSKQDFLFCAGLPILLGIIVEYNQLPKEERKKINITLGTITLAIVIPVITFGLFLLSVGVAPSSLITAWVPAAARLNLINKFPVWQYYNPFNFRIIIFGMILICCFVGSLLIGQKRKMALGMALIFGLSVLLLRQVYKDSIQFDFRSWVVILSLGYALIHLTQAKEAISSKNYLSIFFSIAVVGYQMRFILQHGVVNLNWSGNLNVFILFGALLFLIEIVNRVKGIQTKIYNILLSSVMIAIIFSSSLHIIRYYQEDRWKKISTNIGPLYLPDTKLEAGAFSEALATLNSLQPNDKVFNLNGDLLFASIGGKRFLSDFQSSYLLTFNQEEEIIKMLSNEKIEYVFLVQDGNYYPQVLGFLYGLDLNTFLKNNYYTYKMWGGESSFEEFKVFKDNLTMIYILKRLPKSLESLKKTGKHL